MGAAKHTYTYTVSILLHLTEKCTIGMTGFKKFFQNMAKNALQWGDALRLMVYSNYSMPTTAMPLRAAAMASSVREV